MTKENTVRVANGGDAGGRNSHRELRSCEEPHRWEERRKKEKPSDSVKAASSKRPFQGQEARKGSATVTKKKTKRYSPKRKSRNSPRPETWKVTVKKKKKRSGVSHQKKSDKSLVQPVDVPGIKVRERKAPMRGESDTTE